MLDNNLFTIKSPCHIMRAVNAYLPLVLLALHKSEFLIVPFDSEENGKLSFQSLRMFAFDYDGRHSSMLIAFFLSFFAGSNTIFSVFMQTVAPLSLVQNSF